jgi:hypothetical protein
MTDGARDSPGEGVIPTLSERTNTRMRAFYPVLLPVALAILLVGAVIALPGCSPSVSEDPAPAEPVSTPVEDPEPEPTSPEEEPLYTAEYTPDGTEIAVITTPRA